MHGGCLKQWYRLTPRCHIFGVLSFQAGLRLHVGGFLEVAFETGHVTKRQMPCAARHARRRRDRGGLAICGRRDSGPWFAAFGCCVSRKGAGRSHPQQLLFRKLREVPKM